MIVQVSRLVRLALLDRFSGPFNDLLMEACVEFGANQYQLNFVRDPAEPQNFYEGNRSWDSLNLYQEPDLPAMTMWTDEIAEAQQGYRSMPRTFSGSVLAHWRFWLSVKGLRSNGLIDLREATESAILAMLSASISGEFDGLAYQQPSFLGQSLNEQLWVDQDQNHVGWVQEVEYSARFEVEV